MSTLEEALSTNHRTSTFHVYHKGEEHVVLTPWIIPRKELGHDKKSHDKLARRVGKSPQPFDEANSYFVHRPTLLCHNTPRTLRRGNMKRGDPICIINRGTLWRSWHIQFSPNLKDIIDRRGVVKWEHRSSPNNMVLNDDRALKGYKVRTWRVWGESGQEYHRHVNARRRMKKEEEKERKGTETSISNAFPPSEKYCFVHKQEDPPDCGTVQSEKNPEKKKKEAYSENENGKSGNSRALHFSRQQLKSTSNETPHHPAVAEESVRLNWKSPISLNPRVYTCQYAGINLCWERTRDLHANSKWAKRLMSLNHLRLTAKLPDSEHEPIFLGQFTSSFSYRKFGELLIFDSAVAEVLKETGDSAPWCESSDTGKKSQLDPHLNIRETRLYDIIIASAMCMVIGEWQKRMCFIAVFAGIAEAQA